MNKRHWMTAKTHRAPFSIVDDADKCHGSKCIFSEVFSKVCHEESAEFILTQGNFNTGNDCKIGHILIGIYVEIVSVPDCKV